MTAKWTLVGIITVCVPFPAFAIPVRGTYNIKTEGGAACDGTTDDRAAIQNLLDNIAAGGSTIIVPSLICQINGTITVNKQFVFRGGGRFNSVIRQGTAGAPMFTVTTPLPVEFHDMELLYASQQTAGACMTFASSTINSHSIVSGMMFSFCFIGVAFDNAAYWIVSDSVFQPVVVGLRVANTLVPDAGDSTLKDSLIVTTTNGYGVQWFSSGGLRIVNNKMLNVGYGVLLWPSNGVSTGIIKIHNNSIEHCTYACVLLTTTWDGSNGLLGLIEISGNELATGFTSSGAYAVAIDSPQASDVIVSANNLFILGNNSIGVGLLSGQQAVVQGNIFESGGFGFTGTVGVKVLSPFSNATVGENNYAGLATEISNSSSTSRLSTARAATWSSISGWTAPANGSNVFCSDCKGSANGGYVPGAVCSGAGSGALARVVAGAWRCW
jgi:hypothetical protein